MTMIPDRYLVGVGTKANMDDIVPYEVTDTHTTVKCWDVKLTHNTRYFTTVTAYHGGHDMLNATAVSNGGRAHFS